MATPAITGTATVRWNRIAERVVDGESLRREEAVSVLEAPDDELLALLHAAFHVRAATFGRDVQLYYLVNAKSGLCPEDCHYCSQSRISTAEISRYPHLSREALVEGARQAVKSRASTYCIVASGRGPTDRELAHVIGAVEEIKGSLPLRICCCLGILSRGQAERLRAAGVDRYNHNLNTSKDFHGQICTTHGYTDRVHTVEQVKAAGISPCCGGIVGMGESSQDVVNLAFALRDLEVESIPVNFYHPVPGTPLAQVRRLNPRHCLRVLCMFRFVNPRREIRIAGGRELHLGAMQPLGLYPANSIFVSDYLTTKGQSAEDDFRMIEDMGFRVATPQTEQEQMAKRASGLESPVSRTSPGG